MKKFSDRLVSIRKTNGVTQDELARIIKKTRSAVSGYETEGKEPDLETVCLIAKHFGVSTDYLIGYSDRPNHTEDVFLNDTVNFKKHFENLPADMRPAIAKCFDHFYRLLNRDMQLRRAERIDLYEELLNKLCSLRAEIRKRIEAPGDSVLSDPVALSEVISLQSQLKNEVAILLDKLMQADMEVAFNQKKDMDDVSKRKSAM